MEGESKSSSFVVAVSSAPGGGKTTLVTGAAELLGATMLFFDDYRDASTYPPDGYRHGGSLEERCAFFWLVRG